jgi:hypothetical protein
VRDVLHTSKIYFAQGENMDKLKQMRERLKELESVSEDYPGHKREMERQIIVECAVSAADDCILEGSDGSAEETDYLTSAVASKMLQKVDNSIQSRLRRVEMQQRVWGGDIAT